MELTSQVWRIVRALLSQRSELDTGEEISRSCLSQDYVNLKGLNPEEQEQRLLELAETGQMMARELYSYDLKEARAFVEDFLRTKASAEDLPSAGR